MRSRFVRGRWVSLLVALLLVLGTAQAVSGWVKLTDDMRALNTAIGTASCGVFWACPPSQATGYLGDTLTSLCALSADLGSQINAVKAVELGVGSLVGSVELSSSYFGALATDIDAVESALGALGTQLDTSFAGLATQIEGFGTLCGSLMRDLGSQMQSGMLSLGTIFGSRSEALRQSLASMGDAALAQLVAADESVSSVSARDVLSTALASIGGSGTTGTPFDEPLGRLLTAVEGVDAALVTSSADPNKVASIFSSLGELQVLLAALPAESLLEPSEAQLGPDAAVVGTIPFLMESLQRMIQGSSEPEVGFWEALGTFADGFPHWLEAAPAAVEGRLSDLAGSLTEDISQVFSVTPELDGVLAALGTSNQTLAVIQTAVGQISGRVAEGFAQLDGLLGAAPESSSEASAALQASALVARAGELRAALVALEGENARLRNANAVLFAALRAEAYAVLAASVNASPWQAFTASTGLDEEVDDGAL